jgi:hypothetical protein
MPASTYEPLGSFTTTTGLSQVTFSNIPQNYTDLVLVTSAIANATGADIFVVNINGDSTTTNTNYSFTDLYGTGSAAGSYRTTNSPGFTMGNMSGPSSTEWCPTIFNFNNYSNNTTFKTVLTRSGSATTSGLYVDLFSGTWRSTQPINSIALRTVNGYGIKAGTTFNLYGVGANQLKATGGDIIQTDGTYWYHAFTKSGTFTPLSTLSCDVLVVAGGAGGGGNSTGSGGVGGGGGGAGGYRSTTSLSLSTATTVTVGAGGAGGSTSGGQGSNGSNSVFSSITSTGGGGGGGTNNAGSNGGSGGGGYFNTSGGSASPVTSPVQGYAGGLGATGASYRGGGGGGATAAGVSATVANPDGGTGSNALSSWLTVTGQGVGGYIAGGGGGGAYIGAPGVGGAGGGGAGGANGSGNGASAPANTGGGGGGAGYAASNSGGNGGSGLVIVRYAV